MNVLAILPGFIPSTIIGVLRPLAELERQGEIKLRVRLFNVSTLISRDIAWCDVAVFCRNCEMKDLPVLYELKRKGKKIVYEIDDNFEEIPLTTYIGLHHRAVFRLHALKRFFFLSEVTRVYSDRLSERVVSHGGRPQLIRSYFDRSIVNGLSRRAPDGVIRIAYPTGRIDDGELEETVFSAMRVILEKYAGEIEFHLWRSSVPPQLSGISGVVLNKGVSSYEKFIQSFFQVGFDIGLAPGIDVPFFHSKTNNKYREFGGCGIAGVYSNFPPYSNSVTHEHTGLLAGGSTEDWIVAIERLLLDNKLRAWIVKNAACDVSRNYSFESAVESWHQCLSRVSEYRLDIPEWFFSSEQCSLFAFVDLVPAIVADFRFGYFRYLNSIPGVRLVRFPSTAEYLKSSSRQTFAASIFILLDEKELKTLSILLPLSVSAIVDMTTYADDLDRAIRDLCEVASVGKISFLFTQKQAKEFALVATMKNYVVVDDVRPLPTAQDYSLSGYPAAYIELAERHKRFGTQKINSDNLSRLNTILLVITASYALWKTRFEKAVIFVKVRLGFRRF